MMRRVFAAVGVDAVDVVLRKVQEKDPFADGGDLGSGVQFINLIFGV